MSLQNVEGFVWEKQCKKITPPLQGGVFRSVAADSGRFVCSLPLVFLHRHEKRGIIEQIFFGVVVRIVEYVHEPPVRVCHGVAVRRRIVGAPQQIVRGGQTRRRVPCTVRNKGGKVLSRIFPRAHIPHRTHGGRICSSADTSISRSSITRIPVSTPRITPLSRVRSATTLIRTTSPCPHSALRALRLR